MCVCLCARPARSPAPPGCGFSAGACAWAWVAATPRHSWLGCWGVCAFLCAPRLYPAILGWGVRCGRVSCAQVLTVPRHSWLGCWGVCVFVRVPRLHLAIPDWVVCVCVCGLEFRLLSGLFLAWAPGRVASCVRRVDFWSPTGGPPVAWECAGVAVGGVCPPPSPLVFFAAGGCRVVSCRGFVVSVAACPGLGSRGLRPPFLSHSGCAFVCFVFARLCPSEVCVGVFRVSFLPVGRCSQFGVAGFGSVFLGCSFGGSRLWCCLAWGFGRRLWCGWAVSWLWAFLVPPPLLRGGGVCLFPPLPSLGWSTHWSTFGVVNKVAVDACMLLGLALARWFGWVLYTLGSWHFLLG